MDKTRIRIVAAGLVMFLAVSVGAGIAIASSSVVDVEDGKIDAIGSTTTVNITLDKVPDGLSGYNLTVSLSNTSIAEILSVSFPSWATLYDNSTLPADSVWMKAADLTDQVKSGDTNILLGRLTIRADSQGTSDISATVTKMDDDSGYPINTSTDCGHLIVGEVPTPTYVSGIISSNTTWTAADSPYIVTGSILVEEGVTLTVEPGVVVKFNSAKALQIDGELIARGTEAEPIVFSSNQSSAAPGDWCNIVFSNSSVDATYDEEENYVRGSIMQYCTVKYGGANDTTAVEMINSSPFINYCNISDNAYCGAYIKGGTPKIFNSTISNNSGNGVYANESTVEISRCTIINNSACLYSCGWLDPGGGGIFVRGGVVTINSNNISGNYGLSGGAIYVCHGTVNISDNIINNNRHGAIEAYGSTLTIRGNTIHNSTSGFCGVMSGGAITLTRNSVGTISDNSICSSTGNSRGHGINVNGAGSNGFNIMNNTISNNGNSGIDASAYVGNGMVTIRDNIISNNGGGIYGGIWAYSQTGPITISNNTITHNSGYDSGGIYASARGKFIISNNTITNNTARRSGGGISARHSPIITNNKITGNSVTEGKGGGIEVSGQGQPIINYNDIYDNSPYDVYNSNYNDSSNVNATNNWWGTTDEPTIQAHIYDWFDDASLGIVDYIPYLTEPVTPENMPPIVSFTYSPENPVVNETITFNASNSTDPDGNITSYKWDFGDGNNTNTTAPLTTYSYASAGTYNVNLTVTDDDGATNSTSKIITVYKPLIIQAHTNKSVYECNDTVEVICVVQNETGVNITANVSSSVKKPCGFLEDITFDAIATATGNYNASYTNTTINGTYYVTIYANRTGYKNTTKKISFQVGGNSPCFIATAAYGTPLHEDIGVLRDFRDEYLVTNPAGRAFVKIYYTTSPPIADAIRENEGLRTAAREGLVKPLVYISRLFVG